MNNKSELDKKLNNLKFNSTDDVNNIDNNHKPTKAPTQHHKSKYKISLGKSKQITTIRVNKDTHDVLKELCSAGLSKNIKSLINTMTIKYIKSLPKPEQFKIAKRVMITKELHNMLN